MHTNWSYSTMQNWNPVHVRGTFVQPGQHFYYQQWTSKPTKIAGLRLNRQFIPHTKSGVLFGLLLSRSNFAFTFNKSSFLLHRQIFTFNSCTLICESFRSVFYENTAWFTLTEIGIKYVFSFRYKNMNHSISDRVSVSKETFWKLIYLIDN